VTFKRNHARLRVHDPLDQHRERLEGAAFFFPKFVPVVRAAHAGDDVAERVLGMVGNGNWDDDTPEKFSADLKRDKIPAHARRTQG
jgi:hypothetical protein